MPAWSLDDIRGHAKQLVAQGRDAAARQLYLDTIRQAPRNGPLLNSAGNFFFGLEDFQAALDHFDRALQIAPDDVEALLNHALALSRLERIKDALAALRHKEYRLRGHARYWAVRASIERDAGLIGAAAASYDHCLALDRGHQRALHGRARLALERGEAHAVARFEQLLATQQGDPYAWLGYAQALDNDGQSDRALEIGLALNQQAPGWTDALQFVSELYWARGDSDDFSRPYALAARARPDDRILISAWCEALAGADRYAEAADVAAQAANRLPDAEDLRLAEAAYCGAAGDDDRAGRIFSCLTMQSADRQLQEARHRLRLGEPEEADRLLSQALDQAPDSVTAWALRDLAWRLMDDSRSAWLHGRDGLVQMRSANMPDDLIGRIINVMHRLHDRGSAPLGQSIRSGTQTRGALFDRAEPDIALLRQYIEDMVQSYRKALPPADARHPLLRHRDDEWAIKGSWSIRARRAGHHNEHVHPQGIVSSAFYLILPTASALEQSDLPGALELGRPPRDLRLNLPPLQVIAPRIGHCALFPSTLYHGTRPFEQGERMTIAFDIAPTR